MAWTAPRTWVAGELVTATLLNVHLRDNLDALKAPPTLTYEINNPSNYTTTSATFTDVDATNLALAITTTGGDVLCVFQGSLAHSTSTDSVRFDIAVDGTRKGSTNGLITLRPANAGTTFAVQFIVVYLVEGLSAGSHTFKLQWQTTGGTATYLTNTMYPQAFVREV